MDDSGRQTLESMSQALWYNRWTLKKFEKFLRGDILEIGCGIGNFTKVLPSYGKVFAVDINRDYVSETKKLVGEKGVVGVGDIEKGKYFFKNKSFDTVVCLNVLEHIKNDLGAVEKIYELLKKGGYLVLLVPSHSSLFGEIDRSIYHIRRYEKKELIKILKNQEFSIIKSIRLNFIGALGWWLAGKMFKDKTIEGGKIRIFNMLAPLFLPLENMVEPPLGTSILVVAQK